MNVQSKSARSVVQLRKIVNLCLRAYHGDLQCYDDYMTIRKAPTDRLGSRRSCVTRVHRIAQHDVAFDVRGASLLAATCIFLYLRTFLLPAIPLAVQNDAVFFFEHAKRMVDGQVPYRDFFEFVMPGTDIFYAILLRILGVHAWINSCLLILLGVSLCWILIRASKHILTGNGVYLPALLFLIFIFDNARDATHHWYSTLFVLAALLPLFKGRTLSHVFAAGILCGVAICFTQTQGAAGLVAIIVFLILTRRSVTELWKQLALLLLPSAGLVGGMLLFYVHKAGMNSIAYALMEYPRLFTAAQYAYPTNFGGASNDFTGLSRKLSYVLLYVGVPCVYVACLYRLVRVKQVLRASHSDNVLLLTLAGIMLYATIFTGPSYHRLCAVVAPSSVLLIWLCQQGAKRGKLVQHILWGLSLFFFVLGPLRMQLLHRYVLNLPTGRTAVLAPDQYELFRWLGQNTRPGEAFFGYLPAAFALDLRNPTPLDNVLPFQTTTAEQEATVVQSLQKDPARFIFVPKEQPFDDHNRLQLYDSFLNTHYHKLQSFSAGAIWEKVSVENIAIKNGTSQ